LPISPGKSSGDIAWGHGQDARFLNKFVACWQSGRRDRKLILYMAQRWPVDNFAMRSIFASALLFERLPYGLAVAIPLAADFFF